MSSVTPKISIIMPFGNSEKFIARSVQSILSQDYQDFELIGIDDNSIDFSNKILKEINDPRIQIVKSAGSGISAALNTGLRKSTAPFIARMDADDMSLEKRISTQLLFLHKNPEVDLVGTACRYFGNKRGRTYPPKDMTEIMNGLAVHNPLLHASILFRRHLFDSGLFIYDETASGDEDYRLWIRLIANGVEIANIEKVLYAYRIYPGNAHGDTSLNRHIKRSSVFQLLKLFDLPEDNSVADMLVSFHYDGIISWSRIFILRRYLLKNGISIEPDKLLFGEFNRYLTGGSIRIVFLLLSEPARKLYRYVRRLLPK